MRDWLLLVLCSAALGCSTSSQNAPEESPDAAQSGDASSPAPDQAAGADPEEEAAMGGQGAGEQADAAPGDAGAPLAHVTQVRASGQGGALQLSVTIRSEETGCEQYANWWEVLSEDGQLLHRRILAHSHPSEQPFTRSGGPVPVQADTRVIVRAHMHPGGYGGQAMAGSQAAGFSPVELAPGFAADLAQRPPLPSGCAF